jgi:hypothetical protein
MEKRTKTLMLICVTLLVLGSIYKVVEGLKEGFEDVIGYDTPDSVMQRCVSGKPSEGYPCCANGEPSLGQGCCVDGTPSYGRACPDLIDFSQNPWYPL